MARTVLVVESDRRVGAAFAAGLRAHGHLVLVSTTAADGLSAVLTGRPDLVVLDLALPDLDGAAALRMIRTVTDVPVIVTAEPHDERSAVRRVAALADEHLVKPCAAEVLAAHADRLLGPRGGTSRTLRFGGLLIDLDLRVVLRDGVEVRLTRREFDLLAFLAEHADEVVDRATAAAGAWGTRGPSTDHALHVHLSRLRHKLGESGSAPLHLRTVHGQGLVLRSRPNS
ncbi:response regulator transcription factor [Lentzea sp. NPDC058436]|uniref:response regulator transcription factor n=1 Tax=Lentzea sp. NPDC058436 TaxID=3346499 RepID=UPI00365F4EE9